ncbi:MAG: hypothetical protein NVSMB66_7570 [Candidatus Doudnabacteria bacterium]
MEKSPSIKNLAAALMLFHVKVPKIKKDSNNPFFKSKYASLDGVLEAIREPLNESGLVFMQMPSGNCELTTIIIHSESGEYMQSSFTMTPSKNDPQGVGSLITYQRRYALVAAFGLEQEDDDGNKASEKKPEQKKEEPKKEELLINSDKFLKVHKKFHSGGVTMDNIEHYYLITPAVKQALLNHKIEVVA